MTVQENVKTTSTSPGARLRQTWRAAQAPLLAVLGAILIGGVIIAIMGFNPFQAYWEMFKGAFFGKNMTNLASTLNRAMPIVGMGLTAAVAFRAGFFNLGGEGQMVLGGVTAALVALNLPMLGRLGLPAALLSAAVVGGLFAVLAAFFQFRFNVPLLISTLLLNYPARYFASYLVTHPFRDIPSGMNQSYMIPAGARFPLLVTGTQLHAGIFLTLALVIAAVWVIQRTVPGFEMRIAGQNPRFAVYSGINLRGLGYRVMFISGAIGGLVGAIEVLGVHYRFIDDSLTSPLYAWTGVMTALLSGSNPLGVLLAGSFFSAIQTGGFGMERGSEVPRELARVVQALIIMLVAARSSFRFGGAAEGERKE